jgi:hypothetical protein
MGNTGGKSLSKIDGASSVAGKSSKSGMKRLAPGDDEISRSPSS